MIVVADQAVVTGFLGRVAVGAILPFDGPEVAGEGHGVAILVGLRIRGRGVRIVAGEAAFLVQQVEMGGVGEGRERPLVEHRSPGPPIDGEGAPGTGCAGVDAVALGAKPRRFCIAEAVEDPPPDAFPTSARTVAPPGAGDIQPPFWMTRV